MLLLLLLSLQLLHESVCLVGYEFLDNKNKTERFLPANGEMNIKLPAVPDRVAACFSLYVKFNRYSNILPIIDFITNYDQKSPIVKIWGKKIKNMCLCILTDLCVRNCVFVFPAAHRA